MPRAAFISPHLDDAVFSAGGTMASLAAAGWDVSLVTVFTRSVPNPTGFALRCQTDKGIPPDVDYMALRRAEDAAAAELRGLRPADVYWLDLPEAPHRGYHTPGELFAAVRDDDLGTTAAVADRVRPHVVAADLVFAPFGAGGHVDHVHVVRAVEVVAGNRPWWAWHDTPYVLRDHAPQPPADGVVPVAGVMDAKVSAAAAYRSQIGFQFGGPGPLAVALWAQARAVSDRCSPVTAGAAEAFAARPEHPRPASTRPVLIGPASRSSSPVD